MEDQVERGFLVEEGGPPGVFGVFEDDGEVFGHLHIYDRTPNLTVGGQDVRVVWSVDLAKCGVLIWEKMRGIISVTTGQQGRVWLESRDTPGIDDGEWLQGFRTSRGTD